MPAIPLARGRNRRSENLPVVLQNMLFEVAPTNVKDQVSLISRPGMAPFATLGGPFIAGAVRREDAEQGVLCVAGADVYTVSSAGVVTASGTGVAGAGRARTATDGANVMIARGGALYAHAANVVSPVDMPDDIGVLDVVFLAGRFWIATAFDGRVYFTPPGDVTVDPLDYFSAEGSPDALVGIAVSGAELLLLGRKSYEPWNPVGDQDLPAVRAQGRASQSGCASVHSIATADVAAWVGEDNVVYRGGDALPIPIGDADMAATIRKARAGLDESDPTKTLYGRFIGFDGHMLYVLDVPGFGTFAFDLTTNQWTEFSSNERDLFAGGCAVTISEGRWLVGGTYDSKLRLFSPDYHDDDGEPLVRIFTGVTASDVPLRFANAAVECSVGGASLSLPTENPKLAMRYSDDDGHTFSDWSYASLGRQGQYNRRPTFKGPNRMKGPGTRIWLWRTSDRLPFTARTASYSERAA